MDPAHSTVAPGAYHERLLAALERACRQSEDGWAYAQEVARAFEPPLSVHGAGQRLSGARAHGLVVSRPGARGRRQWRRA